MLFFCVVVSSMLKSSIYNTTRKKKKNNNNNNFWGDDVDFPDFQFKLESGIQPRGDAPRRETLITGLKNLLNRYRNSNQ